MGKSKAKKNTCILTETLQREEVQPDMDSSHIETSKPQSFTTSSGKAKKRKKGDIVDQQSDGEDSRLQPEEHRQENTPRKKRKIKYDNTTHVPDTPSSKGTSNKTDQLDQDDADGLLSEKASEQPRKKKKRHKVTCVKDTPSGEEPSSESVQLEQDEAGDPLDVKDSPEKPRKKKQRNTTDVKKAHSGVESSNETVQLDQEDVDMLGEKTRPKKKKKRHKQRESDENTTRNVSGDDVLGRRAGEVTVPAESETHGAESSRKRKKHAGKRIRADAAHCDEESENATRGTQTGMDEIAQTIKSEASSMCYIDPGFQKQRRRKNDQTHTDSHHLEQLKEFVPNLDSKTPNDISKMIDYDLPRYKEFKRRGIALKCGRFTATENEKLRKNVEDFMALTDIDSPTKLFFTDRFKEEAEKIRKLKKVHRFFERIAEGIPRACHYVYARGRRIFDGRNYKGEFTKSEIHQLLKLHTLHGSDWKKISDLTGRSAISLQKRFTQLATNEGAWSKKECQKLLRAVRDYIVRKHLDGAAVDRTVRVDREVLYKRLPWQDIAAKVKTRSWSQCREKWMSVLAVRMSSGSVLTRKKEEIKVKLIKAMYEMQVEDIAYVNWDDLTAVIGNVPPAYVQKKWNKLKICHVPQWQNKCFADIIDFLYEKVLPRLEKELGDYEETQPRERQQDSFLLSNIFQDIDEEADDDDDDRGGKVRRGRGGEETPGEYLD